MKITNAMSLLELQNYVREQEISIHVDYVTSGAAWRVTIKKWYTTRPTGSWIGVGRNIGEALQEAVTKYTERV